MSTSPDSGANKGWALILMSGSFTCGSRLPPPHRSFPSISRKTESQTGRERERETLSRDKRAAALIFINILQRSISTPTRWRENEQNKEKTSERRDWITKVIRWQKEISVVPLGNNGQRAGSQLSNLHGERMQEQTGAGGPRESSNTMLKKILAMSITKHWRTNAEANSGCFMGRFWMASYFTVLGLLQREN